MIACALLVTAGLADAAERKPLFRDHAPLKAVLTAPISQAYAQRQSDVRLYFPGQWSYTDAGGETQRLEVSIRIRGNFRRNYCELPPLRLNFKKSQVEGTLFDGQDKLKLVSPCRHGLESQQDLLLEYMAYRIFEILTDYSFGARLIRLSYVDSDEKLKSWTYLRMMGILCDTPRPMSCSSPREGSRSPCSRYQAKMRFTVLSDTAKTQAKSSWLRAPPCIEAS